MAAASSSATAPSRGTTSSAATAQVSARLPSPGAIPADVANHTRVPASSDGDRTTRPTPWTPGT